MNDPRLNSIHLPPPRRQSYRSAREVLLQAQGYQTICAVRNEDGGFSPSPSHTFVEDRSPKAPVGARYWLVDQDQESVYPLRAGINTIGRAPDNDVVVPDGYISRRHCAILVHTNSGCEVHDTASKNGTYVNGTKLSGPAPLAAGDEIRMSGHSLKFMAAPDAPQPPAHAPTLAE